MDAPDNKDYHEQKRRDEDENDERSPHVPVGLTRNRPHIRRLVRRRGRLQNLNNLLLHRWLGWNSRVLLENQIRQSPGSEGGCGSWCCHGHMEGHSSASGKAIRRASPVEFRINGALMVPGAGKPPEPADEDARATPSSR